MSVRPRGLTTLALVLPTLAAAGDIRGLGAHVHGQGTLNIAVEGGIVAMAFAAPGADIVGFEHAATSDEDRAAIAAGKAKLADPLALFVVPGAAGCTAQIAEVVLVTEGDARGHDDHAGAEHNEFRAAYRLGCADAAAITAIEFAYFDAFPNAEELDIQMITGKGSTGFEVTRDQPTLDLGGAI